MHKILALFGAAALSTAISAMACTSLIATPGATVDSVSIITYSADSHVLYGALNHHTGGTHRPGEMRPVVEWDTGKLLGEIPQALRTYTVNGNINSEGLAITESTWGGREELGEPNGILDYGSLIYIALERCSTAREALKLMTDLVQEYGYASSGESFSIADPNEVWILELIGKGKDQKGAVWVARRIPDGYISGHANQPRIHKFPLDDAETLYSPDVITFARQKGYFDGADADFSFANAYEVADMGTTRGCDARVWAFFNEHGEPGAMDEYLNYAMTGEGTPFPTWVKPGRKLTAADMRAMMGNHFEGTPMSLAQPDDPGNGPYCAPYRWRPMTFKVDGKTYLNERSISTQQTGFSLVAECDSKRPEGMKALMWWAADDPALATYIPIYGNLESVPHQIAEGNGNMVTLSWDALFWVSNYVANQAYNRYSQMAPIVKKVKLQIEEAGEQLAHQAAAVGTAQAAQNLADEMAKHTTDTYKQLGDWLFVKYLDGNVKKTEADGTFVLTDEGIPVMPEWPGYNQSFYEIIAKSAAGERLRLKE